MWNIFFYCFYLLFIFHVVTPAYPQQNSTFNVSISTKKVIVEEFNRGMKITEDIMLCKTSWNDLFEAPNFFFKYRHFIVLLVMSNTAEDHVEWCGLVESKIRFLILNLERNPHINLAHVNPKCFEPQQHLNISETMDSNDKQDSKFCSMWFIGLDFMRLDNLNIDLTDNIQSFTDSVHKHAVHSKVLKDGMKIEARHVRRKQLGSYLESSILRRDKKLSESMESPSSKRSREDSQQNVLNKKKAPCETKAII